MKVAFYKGRGRLFDRLVKFWTRKAYSHCELVLQTEGGLSECLSSSYLDGGVRIKMIALDPKHWDFVEVGGNFAAARDWYAKHAGERYDVLGILGFIFRPLQQERRKWFCSEVVAAVLGFNEPWRFDLAVLWSVLNRKQ